MVKGVPSIYTQQEKVSLFGRVSVSPSVHEVLPLMEILKAMFLQGFVDYGYGYMEVLQNSQKFRVLHRCLAGFTGVRGGYINAVAVPVTAPRYFTNCRVPGIPRCSPYFRGIYSTQWPDAGMGCCTRAPGIVARAYKTYRNFGYGYERMSYRTHRIFGYGYECRTELTEVLCRAIPP